jgi:hypothetical protein
MRTVSNEISGGDTIRMTDGGGGAVRWELQYKNLTDGEWSGVEQLFEASEGRLSTFTFLDPMDNLLMWSEDWTKQAWTADPLMQVSGGIADPVGGTGAMQITNTGQAAQRVVQTIGGASWFQYCFTLYLRADAPETAQMVAVTTGEESKSAVAVGPVWARVVKAGSLSARQDGISFGVELPPGARVDVFAAQVEAQPGAGYYKKTTDRGGVYAKTRFDSDSLAVTADGKNSNSGVVKLVSNW